MRILIALGVSTILLLACSARGAIGQTQGFEIGALNLVEWAGGIGSASGRNESVFAQEQELSDLASKTAVAQRERGTLAQIAFAGGTSGPSSVEQNASVAGAQEQLAGSGPGSQTNSHQSLTAFFGGTVFKPEGIGSANGTQTYESTQVQTMMTPFSTTMQSQTLKTTQYASIGTATNIDPLVTSSLNVQLNQQHGLDAQSISTPATADP